MSWSEERTPIEKRKKEEILYCIENVNAVLKKLSLDSDLTDDLEDPIVQIAIKHWTNERRLAPEEAKKFEDNYRVRSVLQKIVSFFITNSVETPHHST